MTVADLADRVLALRAFIARLGERDLFSWWDDNALTTSGQYVMARLFPRTAALAQLEVALEAATIRHRAFVPQPTRLTLFSLPAALEAQVSKRLHAMKRGEAVPGLDLDSMIRLQPGRSVADFLLEHRMARQEELESVSHTVPSGHTLELGAAPAGDLNAHIGMNKALDRLVAGYAASSRGNCIIPVLAPL
ncbi:MAG TPA: BrxE family protein [Chloroflexota bacterium]|jgi:hypothetical protein